MSPVLGLVFAAAVLLGVAGTAKASRPAATRVALRTAGLPSSAPAARALGLAEVAIAVVVLVVGGRLGGALVALAYAGFAGFSVVLRRRRGDVSCGCFGRGDTPVTGLHLWLNLALAAAGVAVAVDPDPGGGLSTGVDATPWAGVPLLGLVALTAWLLQVALTALPALGAAARPDPAATPRPGSGVAPTRSPVALTPRPEATP